MAYAFSTLFFAFAAFWAAMPGMSGAASHPEDAKLSALAAGMLTYHQAVTSYAYANPAATGAIAAETLVSEGHLPTWFVNPGFDNDIAANGVVRVYLAGSHDAVNLNRMVSELNAMTEGRLFTGVSVSQAPAPHEQSAWTAMTQGVPRGVPFIVTVTRPLP